MAQISITVPDGVLPRVRTAFAATYGWTADSGVTQAEFVRQQIARFIKEVVKAHEKNQAVAPVGKAAEDAAEADIVIT